MLQVAQRVSILEKLSFNYIFFFLNNQKRKLHKIKSQNNIKEILYGGKNSIKIHTKLRISPPTYIGFSWLTVFYRKKN